MGDTSSVNLAMADGHDRYVPSQSRDFVAVGHEGVYEWAVENLLVEGDRFLDLGCGTGYGSVLVAGAGASFDGVDASPAAIEHARRSYAHPNARFFVGDLMQTLPPDLRPGSYDVVFSSEVLEHVVDPFTFARVMADFLRDDGHCFVGTPNRLWSLDNMPEGRLMARSHVMEFTPAALEQMLRTVFDDVTLLFRRFPDGAMESALPRLDRPRLMRAAVAFGREVAPEGLGRLRRKLQQRPAAKEWLSTDIDWLPAGDSAIDPRSCAGLVAVCKGVRR